jgi:2-polyprenyl-3-methyl-5-hydroxy-6-metoxy-1,4-benzoquinol methylase
MKIIYSKKFDQSLIGRSPQWKKNIANDQMELAKKQKQFTKKVKNCPICKSHKSNLFCQIFKYDYLECSNCKHIYCSLKVTEKELEKFYSSEDSIKSAQSKVYIDKKLFNSRVKNIATPKVQFANDQIIKNEKNIWIDIGSGVGELVYAANNLGWASVGYEIDQESVNFAKSMGINVNHAKLDNNFDYSLFSDAKIISFINVLEHVGNPVSFLKQLTIKLPKESFVLFEVPRTPSLSNYLNKVFPNNSNRHIYPPDHLHIFSDKSIALMLKDCDFILESLWLFGQDFSDLFTHLAIEGNIESDDNYNKIFKFSDKFQQILDKNNLSDSVIVLAKKR